MGRSLPINYGGLLLLEYGPSRSSSGDLVSQSRIGEIFDFLVYFLTISQVSVLLNVLSEAQNPNIFKF